MKILVIGAGVIGTLYAAKLRDGDHRVAVLARGDRADSIRSNGLSLEDVRTGKRWSVRVEVREQLDPEDYYDLAIVAVRRDQLAGLMPQLAGSRRIPTVLFMLNNPLGTADLVAAMGRDRVLLGFPGAGGARERNVVRYALIAEQPTTLGEVDGQRTTRLTAVAKAFRASGFRTKVSYHMDAWLKAHAFFVTAVAGAIYLAGGDCRRLSADEERLNLMVQGIREGFAAVHALGLPIRPLPLKILFGLPKFCVVRYWRHFFAVETAEYVFGRHARVAAGEMRQVATDCVAILKSAAVEGAALRQLYRAIDDYAS